MSHDWKQDPRVLAMDPNKIKFLDTMTAKIQQGSKQQMLQQLLSLNLEASRQGISFSDHETALLAEILISHMDPAERKKLDFLRTMSKQLAGRSKN